MIATRFATGVGGLIPADIAVTGRLLDEVAKEPDEKVSREEILAGLSRRPTDRRAVETHFEGAALYSPVAYVPQAVVIAVGRLMDLPPLILAYLGRIANLAIWISMVFVALGITPFGRWAFVALAATPMSLFIAGTLSVDPVTNGLAILWVALFLRMVAGTDPISGREVGMAVCLTVLLTLTKQPFFVLSLLILVVPQQRFGKNRTRRKAVAWLLSANVVAALVWGLISSSVFEPLREEVSIDPGAQISYMIDHPIRAAGALVSTYLSPAALAELITGFVGIFGWLDAPLPAWVVGLHWGLLGLALAGVPRSSGPQLDRRARLVVAGIGFLGFLAITLAMYTTWNAPGAPRVEGIQARYFIPLAWLLVPLLAGGFRVRVDLTDLSARLIIAGGLLVSLGAALVTMYQRYYVG